MSTKLVRSKKEEKENNQTLYQLVAVVVAILCACICIFLPLYLKEGYYSVGTVKYELYSKIFWIGISFVAVFAIVYACAYDWKRKIIISNADLCVLFFVPLAFLSAIIGGNFKECLKGYDGWNMGIYALLTFVLLYFFVSRFGKYYKWILAVLFATTFVVMVIGVLHRLMIDPIGTYEGIADHYKNQFLSTLGQATWYSSFVCTVLPLGLYFYWDANKVYMKVFAGLFTFIGFCTLTTQNSDSAYMAFAGFMAVFFWFSIKDVKRLQKFIELILLFLCAAKFMNLLLTIHPNPILVLDSISNYLIFKNLTWAFIAIILSIWGICIVCKRNNFYSVSIMLTIRNAVFVILLFVIILATLLLVLEAKGLIPDELSLKLQKIPYLTWSDNWGNGRGKTWSFSFQMFADMDIFHKFFGVGPDGYAPYAYTLYQDRLAAMWGERTLTNAHNEWMNAVINYGLFGAAAYIGIFVTSIKSFSKKVLSQPIFVGVIACIVSYMCHNFFCYQQVCCTPFLFLIIGIGEFITRKNDILNI